MTFSQLQFSDHTSEANLQLKMFHDSLQHCTAFSRSCVASISLKHAHEHTNLKKKTHKTQQTENKQ